MRLLKKLRIFFRLKKEELHEWFIKTAKPKTIEFFGLLGITILSVAVIMSVVTGCGYLISYIIPAIEGKAVESYLLYGCLMWVAMFIIGYCAYGVLNLIRIVKDNWQKAEKELSKHDK